VDSGRSDTASSQQGSSAGSGDGAGKKQQGAEGDGKGGEDPKSSTDRDEGRGGEGPEGRTPGRSTLGSSTLTDPADDLDSHGDAPGYVDLTSVSIEATDDAVTISVRTAAPFPAEMPDLETNALMVVGLQRKGDEYFIQGEASTGGWSTTMSRNGGRVKYRGGFGLDGKRMTFTVPWADLGGPGAFRWSVDSSWTRTTMLDTFYGFDRAPQFERQSFPDR
jgi:hypothetical protein